MQRYVDCSQTINFTEGDSLMAAITISRQYGSGGRKVALHVAEILGWPLFDKRLMMIPLGYNSKGSRS